VVAIVFALSPLPLRWWDDGLKFIFFERFVFASFVFAIVYYLWYYRTTSLHKSFIFSLRVWLVFYLTLVIHFNLKINVSIWQNILYDAWFHQVDLWMTPISSILESWHPLVDKVFDTAPWYATLFEFCFLGTFLVLSLKSKRGFHLMFCSTIIVLLLGSLGYVLFPAVGPFLYDTPASPHMRAVLSAMYQQYYAYVSSHGQVYSPDYLINGLAAMPSLHIANILIFSFFIYHYIRPLSIVYIPLTVFIFLEATYTKFHYWTDLMVGIPLAGLAIIITYWLYAIYDRALLPTRHHR
jgi:hypothetical protein